MSLEKDIKKALKENRLVVGSNSVVKAAKAGSLQGIIYADNAPKTTLKDVHHYANVSGIQAQEFKGNSLQLGEACGKPFGILLLGFRK